MKKRMSLRSLLACLGMMLVVLGAFAALPQTAYAADATVSYQIHGQTYGWQGWKSNGELAGTTGMSKRLEAINIAVDGAGISGGITYRVHGQTYGWQGWKSDGQTAGTTGMSKRLEAIQIKLTGDLARAYDVQYRVHGQTYGWQGWKSNGELAGTTGQYKRLEAIEIRFVRKLDPTTLPGMVNYISHAQTYGWLNWMSDGAVSGTTGQSKRLEAVKISVNPNATGVSGGIRYRAHCQTYGWMDWVYDGSQAGTSGQSKRMEAIQIELYGDLAQQYDVWYRAHCQTYGWQGWVKNGAVAGTTGQSKRMEAMQIKLVKKGESSSDAGIADSTSTPIMGASQAMQAQCVNYFNQVSQYPSVYASYGASTINEFVSIVFQEAQAEGVRADVVFAQAMLETGYLKFGGDVKPEQCNFSGIGATGGGAAGASFPDVRTGIRAQVQHLKAYASTDSLNQVCVDPRFNYVTRGIAPTLGGLSGRWASGEDYGRNINRIIVSILS